MDSRDEKPKGEDVVLVHSRTEDGRGWRVLRKREDRVEAGAIHPVQEGKPIHGELVKLTPRAVPGGEAVPLFDVEVQYAPPRAHSGPVQVASDAYRTGWDAIFGAPRAATASDSERPLAN